MRLLIVDDHEHYRELIEHSIDMWNERYEFKCEFADNATEAMKRIIDFAPTIVLADAYIPDMNSMEFIAQCNSMAVPLVVTSDHISPELEDSAIARGARAYLPKSNDPDEIEYILEQIAYLADEQELVH